VTTHKFGELISRDRVLRISFLATTCFFLLPLRVKIMKREHEMGVMTLNFGLYWQQHNWGRWLCCITKADHHRWIRETLKNKIVVGLKNKIVVGHDLRGDLKYLGLLQDVSENKHDFELRDTARYESFQIRKGDTKKYKAE
jgi:hypothetical protein